MSSGKSGERWLCSSCAEIGLEHAPLLALGVGRQQMRAGHRPERAAGLHQDRGDEIEPQLGEVDEVVARQRLATQMRVDEPHAAHAADAGAARPEVGQEQLVLIADDDVVDVALAIDEHADLAAELVRALAQKRRQLGVDDLRRFDAAPEDALQHLLLRRRKALRIA